MLKQTILILITGVIFTVTGSCSDKTQLQPLDENTSILAFGDSLTYGTGTSHDKAYPAVLEKLINHQVINAGIPGEVSSKGLSRLPGLIKQFQPGLIIICHGGNDILHKLDLNKTSNNIQQMINLARQNNSQVVLIGVPEFGLFLESSHIYQALAKKNQLPIADDILADILRKSSLKSDHIHPNTLGISSACSTYSVASKTVGCIIE